MQILPRAVFMCGMRTRIELRPGDQNALAITASPMRATSVAITAGIVGIGCESSAAIIFVFPLTQYGSSEVIHRRGGGPQEFPAAATVNNFVAAPATGWPSGRMADIR